MPAMAPIHIDKDTMLLLKIEAQSVKKDGYIFCVLGFQFWDEHEFGK
jgi:hypothetical protein